MHVTDWLPTLTDMAGIHISTLGPGLDALDGVSHWAAMQGVSAGQQQQHQQQQPPPPRSEILINIDGINGTGTAALRVGSLKLLRSQLMKGGVAPIAADGEAASSSADSSAEESFRPAGIPSLGMDLWCDTCLVQGGCPTEDTPPKTIGFGGTLCTNTSSNLTAAAASPHSSPTPCGEGYMCYLFDVVEDPSESNNLGGARPADLQAMLSRLAHYQALNTPCCSCTLTPDTNEMSLPPKDGVWFTFHDMSDPDSAACDLLREPPPATGWRRGGGTD